MPKMGQGPLAPAEYQAIKQIIIALIADHGPDAVKWAWNKLTEEDPRIGPAAKQAALAEANKASGGGGALLLVGAALLLGDKKHGKRRR
jgi:hypothetical protein